MSSSGSEAILQFQFGSILVLVEGAGCFCGQFLKARSLRIGTGFCKVQLSCFEISHCPVTVHFSLESVRVRRFERKDVMSYRYGLPFVQPTRLQAS